MFCFWTSRRTNLDIESREAVEVALDGFEGALIAVTHDRYLIGALASTVWAVEGERIVERVPDEVL